MCVLSHYPVNSPLTRQTSLLTSILQLDMEKYGNGEDSRAAIERIKESGTTGDNGTQDDGAEDFDNFDDSESETDEFDEN